MNFNLNLSSEPGPIPWPMPPKLDSSPSDEQNENKHKLKRVESKGITKAIALSPAVARRGRSLFQDDSSEEKEDAVNSSSSESDDSVEVDEFFTTAELFANSPAEEELDAQVPTLRSVNKLFFSDDVDDNLDEPSSRRVFTSSREQELRSKQPPSDGRSSNGAPKSETATSSSHTKRKPPLRRPIASRRKRVIDIVQEPQRVESRASSSGNSIPLQQLKADSLQQPSSSERHTPALKPPPAPSQEDQPSSQDSDTTEQKDARIAARKGILMRTTTHHRNLAGMRRAETGVIMSKQELTSAPTRSVPDMPVPKSLRPWLFEEDPSPETMLLSPASNGRTPRDGTNAPGSASTQRSGKSSSHQDALSFSSIKKTNHSRGGANRTDQNSWHFSEGGPSTGLAGRFSTGLKKATSAFGRRSAIEMIRAAETDIVIEGTIDEAVCRICAVCRNSMGYRVVVKKTGRKIRVESTEESGDEYLRAVLLIRQLGEDLCAINVRQSRSDGTRTGIGTLWMFYQRLDKELRPEWQPHSKLFTEGSLTP